MPSLANVWRPDRCDPSTSRMISSFSDAPSHGLQTNHCRAVGIPHSWSPPSATWQVMQASLRRADHAFFEQSEFERLFRYNFLQITGFATKILHLIGICSTRRIASQPPLASLSSIATHSPVGQWVARLISLTIFSLGLLVVFPSSTPQWLR
jgi:hypothetical protein